MAESFTSSPNDPPRRKRKPKQMAVVVDACTGCAGAPVCIPLCPVERCILPVPDADAPPFQHVWIDPLLCIGCRKCTARGPRGTFLDGCPWDAIEMIPLAEWEAANGTLPY